MVGVPVPVRQPQSKKPDTKISIIPLREKTVAPPFVAPQTGSFQRSEVSLGVGNCVHPCHRLEQHSMATSSPSQRTEHKRASDSCGRDEQLQAF